MLRQYIDSAWAILAIPRSQHRIALIFSDWISFSSSESINLAWTFYVCWRGTEAMIASSAQLLSRLECLCLSLSLNSWNRSVFTREPLAPSMIVLEMPLLCDLTQVTIVRCCLCNIWFALDLSSDAISLIDLRGWCEFVEFSPFYAQNYPLNLSVSFAGHSFLERFQYESEEHHALLPKVCAFFNHFFWHHMFELRFWTLALLLYQAAPSWLCGYVRSRSRSLRRRLPRMGTTWSCPRDTQGSHILAI